MIGRGAKRPLPAIEQQPRQEVRTSQERCPATSDFRHGNEAPFVGASLVWAGALLRLLHEVLLPVIRAGEPESDDI